MDRRKINNSTVRLLSSSTGAWTTKLLGFSATSIGNDEVSVILHKALSEVLSLSLIMNIGKNSSGNGLADSIDLRDSTTTNCRDVDVNILG